MSSHKVFRFPSRTSINDIQLFEEEIPSITKHEVLIRVKNVSLNYFDLATANGTKLVNIKDNVVPCSDLAGEIAGVGTAVTDFAKGDPVVASYDIAQMYGGRKNWNTVFATAIDGTLRQYLALPAISVVKIPQPNSLSMAQWSCVPCVGVTAWNALFGDSQFKPGQTVLFQGKLLLQDCKSCWNY